MKTSIGTWAYSIGPYAKNPVDFDTVCQKLAALGYDALELGSFPPHPTPYDYPTKESRRELLKKIHGYGLKISGIAANLWGEKLLNTDDPSKYIAEFRKNCEFAVDLGIAGIRVDTVQPPTIFAEVDYATAKQRLVSTWKVCADIAAEYGLLVSWEAEPGFAFNKPSEIMEILAAIPNKNFGFLYDTCHAQIISVVGARQNGVKETFACQTEFLKMVGPRINHIHLIDSDNKCHKDADGNDETSAHPPFGLGILNFDVIVPELLKYHPYTGWWTNDLCFWDKAWEATEICKTFMDGLNKKYQPGTPVL